MSDFNNQTPPNNGQRPDYSYNWNGSEHNRNQKNNGNRSFIIVLIVFALASAIIIVAALAGRSGITYVDDSSATDSDVSMDVSANIPDTSHPSPVIDYDKEETDLSNAYTAIYESVSPSCCTVIVKDNGQPISSGSGFVFDSQNGYIGTNHHVIESGTEITVVFYNGDEYEATLINSDSTTDLAVLKVDAKDLKAVKIGDSEKLKVGQNVVAIGTPYDQGLAGTMTCGIISGLNRKIDITNDTGKVVKTMTLIQTDCSINPGNSGGALIDMAGNVVGVTSLKLVADAYENIGFAIPISGAIEIFQKLIAGEDIGDSNIATATAKIGIDVAVDLESGLRSFGVKPRCEYPQGVLVLTIERDASAYVAGLSVLDIITSFGGEEITSLDSLDKAMKNYKAGDEVTIQVFRFNRTFTGGETLDITFKLDPAA